MANRRLGLGWLVLASLSGLCVALAMLHAAEVIAMLPARFLWARCCQSAAGFSLEQLFAWLWTGVPIVGLMLLATGLWNLGMRINRSRRLISLLAETERATPGRLVTPLEDLGLQGRVQVFDSRQPTAFCCGLLRPSIWISTALLKVMPPRQLRAVLLHERHHMQRWHPLITLALQSLVATLFFLPAVGELCDLLLAHMELRADWAAIEGAGKKSLAGALHLLLSQEKPSAPQTGLALSAFSATQARIDQIVTGAPLRWRPSLAALASAAGGASVMCLLLMGGVG